MPQEGGSVRPVLQVPRRGNIGPSADHLLLVTYIEISKQLRHRRLPAEFTCFQRAPE